MSSSSVNLEAYNTTTTSTTSSRTTRARNKTHIQQQAQQQHGLNNYNNSNNSSHQYNASRQQTAHRGTSANVVSKRQVPHVKDQNVPNVRGSSYHRQQSQQQQQQQQHHGDVSAAATHSYNLRTRIRSSNNAPQYYPNRKNSDAVTGISENKAASLIAPQMSQIQQQQQVQPSAPPAPLAHYYQSYHLNNNQLPYYKDVNNNELIIERIEKKFEQQQQQEKQNDEPDSRTNQPIIVVSKSELNRLTENSISVLNATTSANTAANGVTGVNGALKRAYDYFDSTEDKESVKQEEDEDGEASSYGMIKKVCSADSGNMRIMRKAMDFFFALLREPNISSFLERDSCCLISDKYALAMVFTYFIRAGYHTAAHFTQMNFYIALYLASDIEEDIDEYKYEIFPWALGHKWRTKFSAFLRKRDEFLLRIGYRAIVSRKCCDEVMSIDPNNKVWKRERNEDHGGATRAYMVSRSRRIMSTRPGSGLAGSNVINIVEARTIETAGADEEINLPRGPEETARPCPLCFINKNHANVNFGKILSPQTPQVPPIQYLPTNAMTMTNSLLQTPVSIANHHKNPTNVTNNNSSNVQIAVNNSQDNTSQDDSTLCDKNGRASTHYIKFTTEKQVSDDDVIVLDASSSSISSTCSSKQQLPIKQDQVKQSTQATTTTTQQSRLKRTESKLVKTPKPSSSADIIVLDSKSLKEETDETATKTQQQPKPCGKELAPDTTERLPHTRQLSSAALHLSPSRHHSNLLTKLHTTTTTATNPTCDATYASSSSGVSTASSTMTSRSSSTSGYNHHHHHRHHGQSTVLPAAPNNVAAPILMSKCPSLASVNSYYLHGDDTTVANTSDEYYYDDEEDDDEVDVDEDELDASDDDNEVFSAVNDAKANQQQQQQRLGHIQANKKHHHHHHNNASELLSSTTSSSRKHRHHSQGHKKRQLSNSAALLFTAAAALESTTTTTTTTTATVKSKSKSKSAALNDQLVPRDILK